MTWIAGWRLEVIRSTSMSPTVPKDSLTAVVTTDPRRVEEDDVIAFRDPMDRRRVLLHRVIEVVVKEDGSRFFRTRGDGNRTADPLLAQEDDVRGRLRWHVPKIGAVAWRLRPPAGLLMLVGLPGLLLVLGEFRRFRTRNRGPVAVAPAGHPEASTELAILNLP
jgi:signal peptidase